MKSPRQSREPIGIKCRANCVSPSKNLAAVAGPTTNRSSIHGQEKTQRIYLQQESLPVSPSHKENVTLREPNRNSTIAYQAVTRNRSPARIEIEKHGSALPVKFTEPLTTIPMRELQQLHQRYQVAEVKLHESSLLRATLEMEKKQFSDAYQELKVSSQQEKRQLVKLYEELKGSHEALSREHASVKLENQMLSSRLAERSGRIEELLKNMRDRSSGGSVLTERRSDGFTELKDGALWKQKYERLSDKVQLTAKITNSDETDPQQMLEALSIWIMDLVSIHNSQKSNLQDEIAELREQLLRKAVGVVQIPTEKILTGSNLQLSIARRCTENQSEEVAQPVRQTVPLVEQRRLLIEWKSNLEAYYQVLIRTTQRLLHEATARATQAAACPASERCLSESGAMLELQQLFQTNTVIKP